MPVEQMKAIVILLFLSAAAFGQECEKKGPNVAGLDEWKWTCNDDGCAFENEEELKMKFADLIKTDIKRSGSDGTRYLEISTQVKTETTIAPTTTTAGSNDASKASAVTMTAGISAEPSTTPPSPTKATTDPFNVTASSNTSCTQSSFAFTTANQTTDYIRYNGTFKNLTNFALCAWLLPTSARIAVKGSLFSYCAGNVKDCKSLNVIFSSKKVLRIVTNIEQNFSKVEWQIKPITSRSHFCVTASTDKKFVGLFINGESVAPPGNFTKDWKVDVPSGGLLIIGHEQDPPDNHDEPFFREARQAFVGKIENLKLWDRILNKTEIQKMNRLNCSCPDDAILTLNETTVEVEGNVNASYSDTCI